MFISMLKSVAKGIDTTQTAAIRRAVASRLRPCEPTRVEDMVSIPRAILPMANKGMRSATMFCSTGSLVNQVGKSSPAIKIQEVTTVEKTNPIKIDL
jgi:hypothetical protein